MAPIFTLVGVGIVLLLVEVFLPGGVCGVVGVIAIAAGVVLAFGQSTELGITMLISTVVIGLIGLGLWLKFFPSTSVGKKMFLAESAKEWHGFDDRCSALLGKRGTTHTDLRPSGLAVIDDERVDVVTQGEMVDKGVTVEVIEVEGNRIVVTPVTTADTDVS